MVKITICFFSPPEEGIRHKEKNIVANVEGRDLGNGTLYITESQLSWLSQEGQGFSLFYPAISLHAISRDLNSFPDECLYLQVDSNMIDHEEDQNVHDEDSDEEDCEVSFAELRFIPANKENLEGMFSAMSDCQALHPDENDTNSEEEQEEEEEDAGFYFQTEGAEHLTEHGHATLQHLENIFQVGQGDVSNIVPLHENGDSTEEAIDEAMEIGQFDDADLD
ncbi:hypothetical protein CHS0354_011393 [Potamilus streckersoni]|uniref:Methylosome subunit pICln n=1 Tax=Potamilus streckersoni TaxID=2493646 RepID=A0AAE0WCL3_9BIVA|nr:hypothetical protein CHS0354_011393 [Potamilus streckersoni]